MSSLPLEMPHEYPAHPDLPPEHNPAVEASSSVARDVDGQCGHDWKTHVEDAFAPQCGHIRIGYLVVDELGEPYGPGRWSDEWRQLCRAAGVPRSLCMLLGTRR